MAGTTDPLAGFDPADIARAQAELAAQLAFATGAVKDLGGYLLGTIDSIDQLQTVLQDLEKATDRESVTVADLIEALPDSHVGGYPTAVPADTAQWHRDNGLGGSLRPPPEARRIDATDVGSAVHDATRSDGGDVLAVLQEIARQVQRIAAGQGAPQERKVPDGPYRESPSWLDRMKERTRQGVNRLGRRAFGSKPYNALRKRIGNAKDVVKARWAGATVGRGVAGAAMGGGRVGAQAGAMFGPVGMAVGAVAGTVAAAGAKVFSVGEALFSQLANSLTRYLSPIAILSSTIQAQTSGNAVAAKSASLLGNVLGSALAPAFLLLSAVLITLAGELAGPITEAVKKYGATVVDTGIKAVELFVLAMGFAVEKLQQFAAGIDSVLSSKLFKTLFPASTVLPAAGKLLGAAGETTVPGMAATALGNDFKAYAERQGKGDLLGGNARPGEGGAGDFGGKKEPSLRDKIIKNLELAIKEQQRGIGGGQPQTSELGGAQRAAQVAALGVSPIDQKQLEAQLETVQALFKVLNEIQIGNQKKADQ